MKIKLAPGAIPPKYATSNAAGADLHAHIEEPISLWHGHTIEIPTGVHVQIPEKHVGLIRSRSGMAFKHGVFCLHGTIDSDYRGEIKALLYSLGRGAYRIEPGDRVCQLIITPYYPQIFEVFDELDASERGEDGFGSTGRGYRFDMDSFLK